VTTSILTPATLHVVDPAAAPMLVPSGDDVPERFAPILEAEEVGGEAAGRRAARIVAGLLADGSYRTHRDSVAIHEIVREGHQQVGLVGAVPVSLVDRGLVRPHEQTRADREDELSTFLSASGIDLGPVVLAHGRADELAAAIDRARVEQADATFAVGPARHRIWVVDEPAARDVLLVAASSLAALTVVDGHHRVAAARHRRDGGRARFLAELVAADTLRMLGFDRRVHLGGLAPASLLERLETVGTCTRLPGVPATRPSGSHEVLVYLDGAWHRLVIADDEHDPVDRLPVVGLQRRVLGPIVGIDDPRTDDRIEHLPGTVPLAERAAATPPTHALFVPRAVTVEELDAVVRAGRVLPPKSTYVEPRPGPAVFLRPHDHVAADEGQRTGT
jgi:uncharacterized protein (DUF1015 family)